jgi:hypothetical protein
LQVSSNFIRQFVMLLRVSPKGLHESTPVNRGHTFSVHQRQRARLRKETDHAAPGTGSHSSPEAHAYAGT